jgi:hypothetical protein
METRQNAGGPRRLEEWAGNNRFNGAWCERSVEGPSTGGVAVARNLEPLQGGTSACTQFGAREKCLSQLTDPLQCSEHGFR